MILKVNCVECGKEGRVLILKEKILSRKWWYFGRISGKLTLDGKEVDYWECRECRKREF